MQESSTLKTHIATANHQSFPWISTQRKKVIRGYSKLSTRKPWIFWSQTSSDYKIFGFDYPLKFIFLRKWPYRNCRLTTDYKLHKNKMPLTLSSNHCTIKFQPQTSFYQPKTFWSNSGRRSSQRRWCSPLFWNFEKRLQRLSEKEVKFRKWDKVVRKKPKYQKLKIRSEDVRAWSTCGILQRTFRSTEHGKSSLMIWFYLVQLGLIST